MAEITAKLRQNRPALKDNSITTYASSITNFLKKGGKTDIEDGYNFLKDNNPKVIEMAEQFPLERRKTIYTALTVLFDDIPSVGDQYKKHVYSTRKLLDAEYCKQEKTEKQEKNWVTQDKIKEVYQKMEKEIKPLMAKHESRTRADLMKIQDFVILSLYVLQDPRRNEDYLQMKHNGEIDDAVDNYYTSKDMVFNQFKNSNTKGQQRVPLSKKLKLLLGKWKMIQNSPYLLVLTKSGEVKEGILENGKQATDGGFIRASLNKSFGKNVSVNILRHSILSEKYPVDLCEANKTATNMGTSFNMALSNYVKK
jgi:hypothetical protein